MHNPDVFGYLQFASDETGASGNCRNVFWLSRFILAQLYQAEADGLVRWLLGILLPLLVKTCHVMPCLHALQDVFKSLNLDL